MRMNASIALGSGLRSRLSLPGFLIVLALIIAVPVAAWSLFWRFAANEADTLLDAWIDQEKSVDRIWTCPGRQIAGYPFRIEISCVNAAFSGEIFGQQAIGSLKGVHVDSSLFHPDRADAVLEAPFELQSADGDGEVTLQWDRMSVRLEGLPQDFKSASIDAANVSLQGGLKGLGALAGQAQTLSNVIAAIPERRAEDAYMFRLALDNASIPSLDSFLGTASPDTIKLEGIVTKAGFGAPGTIAQWLDRWRSIGGVLELNEAAITHGPVKIAVHGSLQLDDQHRPQGQLDARFIGAEPVLRSLGVNPAVAGAGSLLTSLFGGRQNGASASDDTSTGLRLPVKLRSGFVSIGPVKTSLTVPALY